MSPSHHLRMASIRSIAFFLVVIISCLIVTARPILRTLPISDGFHADHLPESPILLQVYKAECEQTYGFLPCTTTAFGNVFLIVVYGYLMFLAATFLSNGSELLLEILGPGLIGGLFLPMLGALPDAMLILVSGLSGSKETAQSQVSVGMGLLAGSTVMLLTFIWGSCVICGKCDLHDALAVDSQDTYRFNLIHSGITTDIWTSYAAMIMGISVIPFIIVQVPQMLHSNSGRHLAVLIALIVSLSLLITYCGYQVFQPWIQGRRIEYAKHKHFISGVLRHLKMQALGRLLDKNGIPDVGVIKKLFESIDMNGDGKLTASELLAFVVGIRFEEIDLDKDYAVEKVMREFDTSANNVVECDEFVRGILSWLNVAKGAKAPTRDPGPYSINPINDYHRLTKRENELLVHKSDESEDKNENTKWTSVQALLLLLLGTAIAAAFADPLVDAVDNFSVATNIPSFFISFIALPFATNASEAVSAIIFARRKTRKTTSLTFSELYGAVTMNNVMCLSVFLALVYVRGLVWNFSSEVLVILIVCIVMGVFAGFRTTFPLWSTVLAFSLYPLSLLMVYVLDYVFGWS